MLNTTIYEEGSINLKKIETKGRKLIMYKEDVNPANSRNLCCPTELNSLFLQENNEAINKSTKNEKEKKSFSKTKIGVVKIINGKYKKLRSNLDLRQFLISIIAYINKTNKANDPKTILDVLFRNGFKFNVKTKEKDKYNRTYMDLMFLIT